MVSFFDLTLACVVTFAVPQSPKLKANLLGYFDPIFFWVFIIDKIYAIKTIVL